jgi:hypothetical protein
MDDMFHAFFMMHFSVTGHSISTHVCVWLMHFLGHGNNINNVKVINHISLFSRSSDLPTWLAPLPTRLAVPMDQQNP